MADEIRSGMASGLAVARLSVGSAEMSNTSNLASFAENGPLM